VKQWILIVSAKYGEYLLEVAIVFDE